MYLVLDIGGTKTRIGFSTDGKNLVDSRMVATPQDFGQAIDLFKTSIAELSQQEKIKACAVGIRGVLDPTRSKLLNDFVLTKWVNQPLKESLERIVGCRVQLENDAALVGLGEAMVGAGIGRNIVAYITVSTGLGGVRIVNGQIDKAAVGFEPGNQVVVLWGQGGYTLESLVSGGGLAAKYHQSAELINDQKIWDEVAYELAVGLNNAAVFWSPDIIVLGGSVMSRISLAKVQEHFTKMLKIYPKLPEIAAAKLGEQAGLFGGLYLLRPT